MTSTDDRGTSTSTRTGTAADTYADGSVEGAGAGPARGADGHADRAGAGPATGGNVGPTDPGGIDLARVEAAVREILLAIGEDPERDGLRDTPARVARSYAEIFSGLGTDPSEALATTFTESHDELILVKDIPIYSVCEHHLVPWHGMAAVGYIPGPGGRITGLSKLARVVEGFARRPQVQERLTQQVADAINTRLEPRGVIVVVDAEHLCMAMRGIRKPGARTVTSAVRGILRSDPRTRAEALSLVLGR
jgi:GTP cyclohydrolase I